MIQVLTIIVGVIAIVMGITALVRGELKLSSQKTLSGGPATAAAVVVLLVGVAILAFALIGFPLMLR